MSAFLVTELRDIFYYLNFESVAGEMRSLFKENKLVGIDDYFIGTDETTDTCLFRNKKGHGERMLLELAGLS